MATQQNINWNNKVALREAAKLIVNGCNYSEAAARTGLSYYTVRKFYQKEVVEPHLQDIYKRMPHFLDGPNSQSESTTEDVPVFTLEQEESLINLMQYFKNLFYGITDKECCMLAYQMVVNQDMKIPEGWHNGMASVRWLIYIKRKTTFFRNRNDTVRLCGYKRLRGDCDTNLISSEKIACADFYDRLEKALQAHPQIRENKRIYNLDEKYTGLDPLLKVTDRESEADVITTCCMICADGTALPPAVVMPARHLAKCGPSPFTSSSGMLTPDMFLEVMQHFVKHSNSSPSNPCILIIDTDLCHLSSAAVDLAEASGVHLLPLHVHLQSLIQPLSCSTFNMFYDLFFESEQHFLVKPTLQLGDIIKKAYQETMTAERITSAFVKCGICPFDRDLFTDFDFFIAYKSINRICFECKIRDIKNPWPFPAVQSEKKKSSKSSVQCTLVLDADEQSSSPASQCTSSEKQADEEVSVEKPFPPIPPATFPTETLPEETSMPTVSSTSTAKTTSNASNSSDMDKLKRRLVRSIARLFKENKSETEVWKQLKKECGTNCRKLWERMRALTLKKLKRLHDADDLFEEVPVFARMSLTDWLLYDLVLVHEKIDVIDRNSTKESPVLQNLFELVKKYGIEGLSGDQLTEAWTAATIEYNSKGHQCSPMLMQRRWFQLKELTRHKVNKFWCSYRGAEKRLSLALADQPNKLQRDICLRYPEVIVKAFPDWHECIKQNLVIMPEAFEVKMRKNVQQKSTTEAPDIILVENKVDTIVLDSDSDEENEISPKTNVNKSSDSQMPTITQIKSEAPDNTEVSDPEPKDEFLKALERLELEEQSILSAGFSDPNENGVDQIVITNITGGISVRKDLMLNVDLPTNSMHNTQDVQRTIVIDEHDISLSQQRQHKNAQVAISEINTVPLHAIQNSNIITVNTLSNKVVPNVTSEELLPVITAVAGAFQTDKETNFSGSVEVSSSIKNDIEEALEVNANIQGQSDLIDVDMEFADDGILETDDHKSNATASMPKIDPKLLMNPIVYTTRLDEMEAYKYKSIFRTVNDKNTLDKIIAESKPLTEEDIINSKRVRYNSSLLKKPNNRKYNYIQLCKNPDFNSRLKRLTMGFLSYERNRVLLKACKPMTVDLSKAFESKMVNGTLYLKPGVVITQANVENEAGNAQSTTSIKPSRVPVQSLINNADIDKIIEEELNKRMSERAKLVNLPNISVVKRMNQQLMVQVAPLETEKQSSIEEKHTTVQNLIENIVNQTSNVSRDLCPNNYRNNMCSEAKQPHIIGTATAKLNPPFLPVVQNPLNLWPVPCTTTVKQTYPASNYVSGIITSVNSAPDILSSAPIISNALHVVSDKKENTRDVTAMTSVNQTFQVTPTNNAGFENNAGIISSSSMVQNAPGPSNAQGIIYLTGANMMTNAEQTLPARTSSLWKANLSENHSSVDLTSEFSAMAHSSVKAKRTVNTKENASMTNLTQFYQKQVHSGETASLNISSPILPMETNSHSNVLSVEDETTLTEITRDPGSNKNKSIESATEILSPAPLPVIDSQLNAQVDNNADQTKRQKNERGKNKQPCLNKSDRETAMMTQDTSLALDTLYKVLVTIDPTCISQIKTNLQLKTKTKSSDLEVVRGKQNSTGDITYSDVIEIDDDNNKMENDHVQNIHSEKAIKKRKRCCWCRGKIDKLTVRPKLRLGPHKCNQRCRCCCREKLRQIEINNEIQLLEEIQTRNYGETIENVVQQSRKMSDSKLNKSLSEPDTSIDSDEIIHGNKSLQTNTGDIININDNSNRESVLDVNKESVTSLPEPNAFVEPDEIISINQTLEVNTDVIDISDNNSYSEPIQQLPTPSFRVYAGKPTVVYNPNRMPTLLESTPADSATKIVPLATTPISETTSVPAATLSKKLIVIKKKQNRVDVTGTVQSYSNDEHFNSINKSESIKNIEVSSEKSFSQNCLSSRISRETKIFLNRHRNSRTDNPFFVQKNKILLTNVKPIRYQEKLQSLPETASTELDPKMTTLNLPSGVQIILLPNEHISYVLEPDVQLTEKEIETMKIILSELKTEIRAKGIKLPELKLSQIKNNEHESVNNENLVSVGHKDDEDKVKQHGHEQNNSYKQNDINKKDNEDNHHNGNTNNCDGVNDKQNEQAPLKNVNVENDRPSVTTDHIERDRNSSRNLLSDLMEMSGIRDEDVSCTQTEELSTLPISHEHQISVNIDGKTCVLYAVTSFTELKHAFKNDGRFFKIDLDTFELVSVNVCFKKTRKPKVIIDSGAVIDLTDDIQITHETNGKDHTDKSLLTDAITGKRTTQSAFGLEKQQKQNTKQVEENNRSTVFSEQEEQTLHKTRKININKPKQSRKQKLTTKEDEIDDYVIEMEVEYLEDTSDESEDDEPLAVVAKKMRYSGTHYSVDDSRAAQNVRADNTTTSVSHFDEIASAIESIQPAESSEELTKVPTESMDVDTVESVIEPNLIPMGSVAPSDIIETTSHVSPAVVPTHLMLSGPSVVQPIIINDSLIVNQDEDSQNDCILGV